MVKKKQKRRDHSSTVLQYRHFEELRDCLASGWSCQTTRDYMVELHGEPVPHLKAIQRWRQKNLRAEQMVIPHSVISRKLKGVQYKVDVIGHLSRLIVLCEDRVARGIQSEETDFGGMPVPGNDGVMQVYLQAMRDYVKVAQDLGLLKSPPPVPLIDARSQNMYVTPEILKALRDTVSEIKRIEYGGA